MKTAEKPGKIGMTETGDGLDKEGDMGRHVLIIGGGASGMTAGIFAARAGVSVTVLEHKDRVGKKLLSTGNGRCNFTNRDQRPECYRSEQPDFPWRVIQNFSLEDTLEFFRGLGILPKERNGYFYPNSDQASSVLDALRFELERSGVRVESDCHAEEIHVEEIKASDNRVRKGHMSDGHAGEAAPGCRFLVKTDRGEFRGDALILAAGSKAAPATGSDGSGYELARSLGHHIITPLPALVQLRCEEKDYRQLGGIRTEGRVKLYMAGESPAEKSGAKRRAANWIFLAEDAGEIQLTDYGISGIPVFQVSRYASVALHNHRDVKAVLDFLPRMTEEETEEMLARRRKGCSGWTCEQFMTGLLNKKLGLCLLKRARIEPGAMTENVPEEKWMALLRQIKSFESRVVSANPFEQAQVCRGGVDTREVDPGTMESKKVPGLYFAGEILDVDGICGGYNLQWAWSSGAAAGRAAGSGR